MFDKLKIHISCFFSAESPHNESNQSIDGWMDTVEDCEYEDTNKLFSPPQKYDVRITKLGEDDEAFDLVKKCMT